MTADRSGSWLVAPCLGVLAVLLYLPAWNYPHVWDDVILMDTVQRVLAEDGAAGLLFEEFRFDVTEHTGYYRPLILLSFWFEGWMDGLGLPTAHGLNALLHGLNTMLLFGLARWFLREPYAAAAAAVLFAVHPVHVETVVFVSGRCDLLALTFGLISVRSWIHSRHSGPGLTDAWFFVSLTAFLAALLCKEVAFVLPVVLIGWSLCPAGQPESPRLLRHHVRWWVGWVGMIALALAMRERAGIQFGGGTSTATASVPAGDPWIISQTGLTFCRLLVVPWPLKAYYTLSGMLVPAWSLWIGGASALAFAIGLVFTARRTATLPAWIWFAVLVAPTLGLVAKSGAVVAERFLYMPSAGFCLWIGGCVARRHARPSRLALSIVGTTAIGFAGLALIRTPIWKNESVLFAHVAKVAPEAAFAHYNLGNLRYADDEFEPAAAHFRRALEEDPSYAPAHFNLGLALRRLDRDREAERSLVQGIRINDSYAEAHFTLGLIYKDTRRYAEAVAALRRAVELRADPVPRPPPAGQGARADEPTGRGVARVPEGARPAARKRRGAERHRHRARQDAPAHQGPRRLRTGDRRQPRTRPGALQPGPRLQDAGRSAGGPADPGPAARAKPGAGPATRSHAALTRAVAQGTG